MAVMMMMKEKKTNGQKKLYSTEESEEKKLRCIRLHFVITSLLYVRTYVSLLFSNAIHVSCGFPIGVITMRQRRKKAHNLLQKAEAEK